MMHKQQAPWYWSGAEYATREDMRVAIMTHFATEFYLDDAQLTLDVVEDADIVQDAIDAEMIGAGEWYYAIRALDRMRAAAKISRQTAP